uniref:Uncharacterized protein n=1 Tax=Nelumbo nucifera TaxID=4432 RepID=A0A822YCW7_NELNU|nr:TPA_asm: hypothetical protein HUJ06_031441 [Nelumbo nucifera]
MSQLHSESTNLSRWSFNATYQRNRGRRLVTDFLDLSNSNKETLLVDLLPLFVKLLAKLLARVTSIHEAPGESSSSSAKLLARVTSIREVPKAVPLFVKFLKLCLCS